MAAVEVTTEPVESRDANTKMIGINGSQEVARYDASALVDGPASAADGGIVRFDGTTGKLLKADTTGVVTAEIADDAVTYAKLQNISATDRLLGRDTSGAGNAEELTVGGGLEFTGSGGVQRSALTGDVTASAGSNTTTIAANAVTNAKLATIATQRVKGRATAGTGAVEDVTISQLLDWLGSTQGSILYRGASAWTVLAPGGSGTLLKSNGSGADPSWGTVVGTGDVVGPASATDGALCRFDGTTGKLVKVDAVGIATAEIASGAVTTAKITDANVTYAKIQNVSATSRLLGRVTAGAGVVEEIAVGATLTFASSQLRTAAMTGDVTASANSFATTIGAGVVTFAKMATAAIATAAEYRSATASKILCADNVWSAAALVTLTDAATVAVDMSAGLNFALTIGGNRTLGAPTNTKTGQSGVIYVVQDGTGSRTLAYNSVYKFAGGTAPTLSTAASTVDRLTYFVRSSTHIDLDISKDRK